MSIIGQPIMAGGGGVTANIKVMGDIASSDACYATYGSKTIYGTYVSDTTPYWDIKGIKDYGTWTVTWSNGAVTHTRSVAVDVISEYTVENIDRNNIIIDGVVQDGYSVYTTSDNPMQITYNSTDECLNMQDSGSSAGVGVAYTNVDLTGYDKIKIEISATSPRSGTYDEFIIKLVDDDYGYIAQVIRLTYGSSSPITKTVYSADISSYSQSTKIQYQLGDVYNQKATVKVYNVWLE